MAFFKSFQETLSSVSVSSILDSVSTTVSNTVDGLATAVSDATYTVSDQLTEQVNTIMNKVQPEDEDKTKRDATDSSSEPQDGISSEQGASQRSGGAGWTNSRKHAFADEDEERREREKQEHERKNEEEQWEWCYTPAKGWFRKRRDPNCKHTEPQEENPKPVKKEETSEERVEDAGTEESPGQDDNISKTSTETIGCQESEENITEDHHEHHQGEEPTREPSDQRKNSRSDPKSIESDGGATVVINIRMQEPLHDNEERDEEEEDEEEEEEDEEETGCSSSDQKHLKDEDKVTEVTDGKKETERATNKDRFRRCTIL